MLADQLGDSSAPETAQGFPRLQNRSVVRETHVGSASYRADSMDFEERTVESVLCVGREVVVKGLAWVEREQSYPAASGFVWPALDKRTVTISIVEDGT